MSAQIRDMTKGSPAKLILLFAVPLMLGNIFQQLYTMVDTIVVGQVAGVQALAALGAVEWIMWMVLGVSTGVTQGFSILISQHYGARKWNDLKKAVAHSYLLTAITAVSLLIVSQLTARWILMLLNTPDNIIGMSLIYLRIVFCGIPIVAAYNIFASVLRALGNSRTTADCHDHCSSDQCYSGSYFCCRASLGCCRSCACNRYCSGFFRTILFYGCSQNRYCTYF